MNIAAASIHYSSVQQLCTDTHTLAPVSGYMSTACSSLASLQVNNRCVCILPSGHGWREWERMPFEPLLLQHQPWAADKAVVLNGNHCQLLFWGKFILRWEPLYLARTMWDFGGKVSRCCACVCVFWQWRAILIFRNQHLAGMAKYHSNWWTYACISLSRWLTSRTVWHLNFFFFFNNTL